LFLLRRNHNWRDATMKISCRSNRQFKNETHQPQELTKKGSSGTV
jgi:hypothetical protein